MDNETPAITEAKLKVSNQDAEKVEELKKLLTEWDCAYLLDYFVDNKVFADVLKTMNVYQLDELFKDYKLGPRIMFEHKLDEWRNSMGLPSVESTCTFQYLMVKNWLASLKSPSTASSMSSGPSTPSSPVTSEDDDDEPID